MNQKRIAVVGKPGAISDSYRKSIEELNKEVGLNSGNLAFWHAMSSNVKGHKDYFGWTADPKYIKDNYDVLMFPAANQLNPDWDLSALADLFDKSDLPIVIIGLGAQAEQVGIKLEFKEGTKRFIKVISERAYKIGVRGDYTAEVLSELGVQNISVTGCPSNLLNPNPDLGKEVEGKLASLRTVNRLALNIDLTDRLAQQLRQIFMWTIGREVEVICQAPIDVLKLAHERVEDVSNDTINRYRNLFCPGLSTSAFKSFVRKSFNVYYDTTEWMNRLRKFDLAVGTRMHGNMLAFQAGVPSVLFPHDSRLSELVDIMKMPKYSLNKIQAHTTLERMLQEVEFNGAEYDINRKVLRDRFVEIITNTGLEYSESLDSI